MKYQKVVNKSLLQIPQAWGDVFKCLVLSDKQPKTKDIQFSSVKENQIWEAPTSECLLKNKF